MSDFRTKLKELDDDALDDMITTISREKARRTQRTVAEMDHQQYLAWSKAEIAKAAAAAKNKEQADGG